MHYQNLFPQGFEGSDRQERGSGACGGLLTCECECLCVCVGVQMEPGRDVCSSASWQEAGVPVRGCRVPWRYISKFNHLKESLSPTLFSAPDLDQINPQALPRTASDSTALLPLPLGGWTQSLRGSLPSIPQNPKTRAPLASGIRMYVCLCVQVRMLECEKLPVSLGELGGWDGRW